MFYRRDVVLCILQQLQRILRWMRRQDRYKFFCSSLLIVYDGNVLRDNTHDRYLNSVSSVHGATATATSSDKNDNNDNNDSTSHAQAQSQPRTLSDGVNSNSNSNNCRHFIDKFRDRQHNSNNSNGGDQCDGFSNPSISNRSSPVSIRESTASFENISCVDSTSSSTSTYCETDHEKRYKTYLSQHPTMFLPQATNPSELVQVKMIDLAHSISTTNSNNSTSTHTNAYGNEFPNTNTNTNDSTNSNSNHSTNPNPNPGADVDRGFIHGLGVLIKIFEDIIVTIDNTDGSSLTDGISTMLTSDIVCDIEVE